MIVGNCVVVMVTEERTLKLLLSSGGAAAGLPDVVTAETDNAGTEHGENARLRHFGCCCGIKL